MSVVDHGNLTVMQTGTHTPRAHVRGPRPVQLLGMPGVVQRPGPRVDTRSTAVVPKGRGHASLSAWYKTLRMPWNKAGVHVA